MKKKKKKTNPIGPGTENLCINLPLEWKKQIKDRADQNEMKVGEYCRVILMDAIKRGVNVERSITLSCDNDK